MDEWWSADEISYWAGGYEDDGNWDAGGDAYFEPWQGDGWEMIAARHRATSSRRAPVTLEPFLNNKDMNKPTCWLRKRQRPSKEHDRLWQKSEQPEDIMM